MMPPPQRGYVYQPIEPAQAGYSPDDEGTSNRRILWTCASATSFGIILAWFGVNGSQKELRGTLKQEMTRVSNDSMAFAFLQPSGVEAQVVQGVQFGSATILPTSAGWTGSSRYIICNSCKF